MNHEETIQRIQSLVPSVTELEFGCKINIGYDKDVFFVKMDDEYIYWIDNEGDNCDEDTIELQHLNFEILGKPITLAVIFQAIFQSFLKQNDSDSEEKGLKLDSDIISLVRGHFGYKGWNLSKDNFNDQSEETKTFIGGLIN